MEYSAKSKTKGRLLITLLIILSTFMLISCWNDLVDVYNQRGEETTGPPPVIEPVTWTEVTGNTFDRRGHTSIVYNSKMWIIGGGIDGYRTIYYSTNGFFHGDDYILPGGASKAPRKSHVSIVFDEKVWIMGGYVDFENEPSPPGERENDVYSTSDPDLQSWDTVVTEDAAWSERINHASVAFNSKMWILGGNYYDEGNYYLNDVWSSVDGETWEHESNAPWSGRMDHTLVVFDNKIWIMGGYTSEGDRANDVWYSSNGVDWVKAVENAAWPPREDHTCVVFDNKMWIIGGYYNSSTRYNDVWCSVDGINWYEVPNTGEIWTARGAHTSVVYDNKIWVIGGNDGSYQNDVWYMEL